MLKFDHPKPTKSGRDVIDIWHDLQEAKQGFLTARLNDDVDNMVNNAVLIQEYQNDLGLSITPFDFLSEKDTGK